MKPYWIFFYTLLYLLTSTVICESISTTQLSQDLQDTTETTSPHNSLNIALNLPNSIKLGEVLVISAKIYNNLNETINCTVTLYNDNEAFKFMDDAKDVDGSKSMQFINIINKDNTEVKFTIKPLKIGDIKLHITATNSLYNANVIRKLKVVAGGLGQKFNEAIFEESTDNETISGKFSLKIPEDTFKNSININLKVAADFLKPTIENLDKLIEMPTGTGEANMINFAPGVLILQYLTSIDSIVREKELASKIKDLIEIGYRQQLTYLNRNGGFKVFNESSKEEDSTWLTAYVTRYIIKATKFNVTVDPKVIDSGLEYLKEKQLSDGSYAHNGFLFLPPMESKVALTSFVLVTLLEKRQYANKYRGIINKGVEYLGSNLDCIQDIFDLTLAATAFKCAGSRKYGHIIDKLYDMGQENNLGYKFWSANDGNKEKDIELTSYVALALLGIPIDYTPILKWLIAQRNEYGGFQSTQDTVMGILTLIKLARRYQNTNDSNVTLEYTAHDHDNKEVYKGSFTIDADHLNDFQKQELPSTTRSVEYAINGAGYIFAQLSYQYNIPHRFKSLNIQQYFIIEPKVINLNSFLSNLEICFSYQTHLNQQPNNSTNLIIMEINLPTGFQSDAVHAINRNEYKNLERIESKNDNTVIIMYFASLKVLEKNCVKIDIIKIFDIMELQPGSIKIYDFYNATRSDEVFYNMNLYE